MAAKRYYEVKMCAYSLKKKKPDDIYSYGIATGVWCIRS